MNDWIDLQENYGFYRDRGKYTNGHVWLGGEKNIYWLELPKSEEFAEKIAGGRDPSEGYNRYYANIDDVLLEFEIEREDYTRNFNRITVRYVSYGSQVFLTDFDKDVFQYMDLFEKCLDGNCDDGTGIYRFKNGITFKGVFKYKKPYEGDYYNRAGDFTQSLVPEKIEYVVPVYVNTSDLVTVMADTNNAGYCFEKAYKFVSDALTSLTDVAENITDRIEGKQTWQEAIYNRFYVIPYA